MAFWNVDNPKKPWGLFDPNAELDFTFDWTDWLSDASATYASHTIITDPVLTEMSSTFANGLVRVQVKIALGASYTVGTKYPVTCRLTATSAGLTIKDDRTVYLKVENR